MKKMYHPMMPMIKQIDDNSFDEKIEFLWEKLNWLS